MGGSSTKLAGGGGKSENRFDSRSVQTVYNQSYVDFAASCDSQVGNSITFVITGDNNVISGILIDQNVHYTTECVINQYNNQDFYNNLGSRMSDLADTATKNLSLFGVINIPMPDPFTNTTVNTEQIQEAITNIYVQFNQQCQNDFSNAVTFNIDGSANNLNDIDITQSLDVIASCQMRAENQTSVVNDLKTVTEGNTESSLSPFGWVAMAIIILVIVVVLIVIIISIVRAASGGGGNKEKKSSEESSSQESSSSTSEGQEQLAEQNAY